MHCLRGGSTTERLRKDGCLDFQDKVSVKRKAAKVKGPAVAATIDKYKGLVHSKGLAGSLKCLKVPAVVLGPYGLPALQIGGS
jgi:hypothetical protein